MAETVGQLAKGCRHDPEPQSSNTFIPLNPDPRLITWEHLETLRLGKLGINNKYSRHFNVLRMSRRPTVTAGSDVGNMAARHSDVTPNRNTVVVSVSKKVNALAPFGTLGKPTCGYFFTEATENRKLKFGIPPSDLVKWRTHIPAAIPSASVSTTK